MFLLHVVSAVFFLSGTAINKAFAVCYDHTPYSEIPKILKEFESNNDRVLVRVIGKFARGLKLYGLTISDSELANGKYGDWKYYI